MTGGNGFFKGGIISESFFHFGSNLPKTVPNHYPGHLLFTLVFQISVGSSTSRVVGSLFIVEMGIFRLIIKG